MTQKLEQKHRAGSHVANQENVAELKKGLEVLGELYPILKDAHGKIIDGHHRLAAGFKKEVVLKDVKTEDEKTLVRIWANYRREVTEGETAREIINLAKALEKKGIAKEAIASEVAKLVPFTDRYVRRLLPDEYKQIEHRPKERTGTSSSSDEQTPTVLDKLEPLEPPVTIRQREAPDAVNVFEEAHAMPQKFEDAIKTLPPPVRSAKPVSYIYHVDVKSEQVKVKVTIASGYSIPKDALEVEILA